MSEMQASVENVGRLNRRLSVIVPNHQLEQNKKSHLTKMAKTTRLNGFRLGTPAAFRRIEQLYGDSVWA
ncbi:MAG: trigger factor, partial [Rickettsiella sp.]|nr:trigger factor [Rickettsiella sp.]